VDLYIQTIKTYLCARKEILFQSFQRYNGTTHIVIYETEYLINVIREKLLLLLITEISKDCQRLEEEL
jgi:hypothetical protein